MVSSSTAATGCRFNHYGERCRVEPRGVEPLTSAVQKRHDALLELSTDFKVSANPIFLAIVHFLSFQIIYSGCCTVAALGRLLMGC